MKEIEGLNKEQRQAVEDESDALLILAGAGSGKTRVVTNKIAYILRNEKCLPWEILAITFTKKAANEMKERIGKMLNDENSDAIWVGTFHAMCSKILKYNSEAAGLTSSFTIYDSDDSKKLIKNILHDFSIDTKFHKVSEFSFIIENKKNSLINEDEFLEEAEKISEPQMILQAKVYKEYQKRLKLNNAVDFNDLIGRTIDLLKNNEDIRIKYANKFKYIFVDEYQDTNLPQFVLIQLLSGRFYNDDLNKIERTPKVTVVGDPDQSIYAFRGATIRNIQEFTADFKNSKIIKLEQNYRSTNNILKAANAVINKNHQSDARKLWSENGDGGKIIKYNAQNAFDEASWIVKQIQELGTKSVDFNKIAVIYRVNSLSRLVEEKFVEAGLGGNYKVVGGFKFYERMEIKDVLAYLFAIVNPNDDIHLRRILNVPKRGIGLSSEEKVATFAYEHGCSFWTALEIIDEIDGLNKGAIIKMQEFVSLIKTLQNKLTDETKLDEIINEILETTGYLEELRRSTDLQDKVRIDNVEELVSAASTFTPTPEYDEDTGVIVKQLEEAKGVEGISLFLEQVALTAASDEIGDDEKVTLMSMHTAKGLEYEAIFLMGFEEGTLPHFNSRENPEDLEEERRLAYVAITRAKKHLYISWSASRNTFGNQQSYIPSDFMNDIPEDLIENFNNPIDVGYHKYGQNDGFNDPWKKAKSFGSGSKNSLFTNKTLKEINIEKEISSDQKFAVGDWISHEKFGLGEILKITGKDSKEVAQIKFTDVGIKDLMLSFAKITKLD